MTPGDLYTRQRRLKEVGDLGQQRIARAAVSVPPGKAGLIEFTYLVRAGVGHVVVADAPPAPPFPHAAFFRHPEAHSLAHGAWKALVELKVILGLKSS